MLNAVLRNTVSATILKAGVKSNVIPSEAEATLNCRLLPGEDADAFVAELKKVVADPAIEFVYAKPSRPAPSPVPFDTPLFHAMADVGREMAPEAVTVPYLSAGATDSADLRARGIKAYGILPFPMEEGDVLRMHGNDERIPIDSYRFGVEYLYRVVSAVAK
jgi:acetylornithine deacetylase/succinyl-diaminopimelate desuccinylase-like protein